MSDCECKGKRSYYQKMATSGLLQPKSQICKPLLFKIRVLNNSLRFVGVCFLQPYKMLLKLASLFQFAILAKRLADLPSYS
jgi:hypothetical protein